MIKVLQDWQEIGNSILTLQKAGLPTHETPQKNWDHSLLYDSLAGTDKSAMIADLGCGSGHTLSLIHAMGFEKVHGVDLQISWRLKAKRLVTMRREKTLKPPYRLHKGDIMRTRFGANSCDFVVSISTIEHGVNLDEFFKEARRILKPRGNLFITTDYWESEINTGGALYAYGLPWNIFNRDQVNEFVRIAASHRLELSDGDVIPPCSERTVTWQGESYTFIAVQFRKVD
jgi:SAM-dependent methyltransferase